ncbi:hypothetical protein [Collimonas arenae]|uniref:hypothetical protein n=1 Tax=Collimonas arenae TaxID=279058 RepID=UPI0012E08790|nr:hypothetical protein [Collimonas arenae]
MLTSHDHGGCLRPHLRKPVVIGGGARTTYMLPLRMRAAIAQQNLLYTCSNPLPVHIFSRVSVLHLPGYAFNISDDARQKITREIRPVLDEDIQMGNAQVTCPGICASNCPISEHNIGFIGVNQQYAHVLSVYLETHILSY